MLGIIAWIRPDGRKALVVVDGSDQMACGDPGSQVEESLKVGDLVFLPDTTTDLSDFRAGLTLVRSAYYPQIVQDIDAMAKAHAATGPKSNVIDFCQVRLQKAVTVAPKSRMISAAE